MTNLDYEKGNLTFDNLIIKDITKEIETPFYCYSLNYLKDQYKNLNNAINLQNYEICYAVKSNSNQSIIKNFANMGSGADVVSIGEMKRALKADIAPNKIVFSGVGKNSNEIKYCLVYDKKTENNRYTFKLLCNKNISINDNLKIFINKINEKFS